MVPVIPSKLTSPALSLSVSMTHTHCHTQTAKTVTHYLTLLSRSVYSLPALCSFLWPLKQIYRLRSRKQHWRKVSKGISGKKESQRTFMSVSRSKPEIQAEDTGKYCYVSHTWSAFTEASKGKWDKKTERGKERTIISSCQNKFNTPENKRKLLYAAYSKAWTHLIKHKDNFPNCYFIYLENTTAVNVAVSLNMNEIHTQTHLIVTYIYICAPLEF